MKFGGKNMFSKTIAIGRLTRDPETKSYGEGKDVTRFTIAVDDGFGDKKTTDFYNCSAWNALGQSVQKYTQKGSMVVVEGKFKSSKKDDKTYWELRADQVRFLSSNNENGQSGQGRTQQQQYQQPNQYQQPQYQQTQQFQPNQQFQQQPQYQQPQQQQFGQFQQQQPNSMFPSGMEMNISDDALPF